MAWTIGPLLAADADVLGPLHNHLWRVTYAGLLPPEVLAARDDAAAVLAWRERGLAHERQGRSAEGAVTHVARVDGRPVGMVSVGPPRDDRAPAATELWSLYVAPEQQGSGVARALVDVGLGPGPAYLWVLDGNARAIAFYRREGFTLDGAVTIDERIGAHEVRMVR